MLHWVQGLSSQILWNRVRKNSICVPIKMILSLPFAKADCMKLNSHPGIPKSCSDQRNGRCPWLQTGSCLADTRSHHLAKDTDTVQNFQPDYQAIAHMTDKLGVLITAQASDSEFVSRTSSPISVFRKIRFVVLLTAR